MKDRTLFDRLRTVQRDLDGIWARVMFTDAEGCERPRPNLDADDVEFVAGGVMFVQDGLALIRGELERGELQVVRATPRDTSVTDSSDLSRINGGRSA